MYPIDLLSRRENGSWAHVLLGSLGSLGAWRWHACVRACMLACVHTCFQAQMPWVLGRAGHMHHHHLQHLQQRPLQTLSFSSRRGRPHSLPPCPHSLPPSARPPRSPCGMVAEGGWADHGPRPHPQWGPVAHLWPPCHAPRPVPPAQPPATLTGTGHHATSGATGGARRWPALTATPPMQAQRGTDMQYFNMNMVGVRYLICEISDRFASY